MLEPELPVLASSTGTVAVAPGPLATTVLSSGDEGEPAEPEPEPEPEDPGLEPDEPEAGDSGADEPEAGDSGADEPEAGEELPAGTTFGADEPAAGAAEFPLPAFAGVSGEEVPAAGEPPVAGEPGAGVAVAAGTVRVAEPPSQAQVATVVVKP